MSWPCTPPPISACSRYRPPSTLAAARTLLASDVTRYVGEPLAAIVTERRDQGEDAAELVEVDYEPLEVLLDVEEARRARRTLYPAAGSNVVFDSTALGMPGLTDESFFEGCDVVVKERLVNQRLAPCPLEVRGSAATWVDGRLYQWVSTQHAQGAREALAAANGVESADVRVITPDVGGGFGAKIGTYSEEQLLGRLAKELGRPVSLAGDAQRVDGRPRPWAGPGAAHHSGRHPGREGPRLPVARLPGLRRASWRSARCSRPS